jgi:putative hemolysin
VDLSDRPEAVQRNVEARRTAIKHVSDGGALIVFPAGLIAISPDRCGRAMAVDPEWRTFSAQLIRRTGADVLPVFFFGQNSRLFQFASHVSRTLKLALIFHEVARRTGSVVEVGIGSVISAQEIQAAGNNAEIIRDLRRRTYEVGEQRLPRALSE